MSVLPRRNHVIVSWRQRRNPDESAICRTKDGAEILRGRRVLKDGALRAADDQGFEARREAERDDGIADGDGVENRHAGRRGNVQHADHAIGTAHEQT